MKLSALTRLIKHPSEIQKFLTTDLAIPNASVLVTPWLVILAGFVFATGTNALFTRFLEPKKSLKTAVSVSGNQRGGGQLGLPPPPVISEFDPITNRNLFNSAAVSEEDVNANDGNCEIRKSELPVKVSGIIFGGDAEASLVVLQAVSNGQADSFLLYDTVDDVAEIVDIERERIIVKRDGEACPEFLELERPEVPSRRVAGKRAATKGHAAAASGEGDYREEGFVRSNNKITADRRWVDRLLATEFTKILHDAKATTYTVGNEIRGFLLTKIRPNSIYEKMGLQDGDIVESINGIELTGITQAINTLQALRNEPNLKIQVRRNGKVEEFAVDISN